MSYTQKHTYTIVKANDGIGYLVIDQSKQPWGYHETRIQAEFQIGFLTTGKSIEQRIREFDEAAE
jgi:hypothetical protein